MKFFLSIFISLLSIASYSQYGQFKTTNGSVNHSGGAGSTSGTPISITGSGKLLGVRVRNTGSSGYKGSISVKIDGVTYASANVNSTYHYLQDNIFDGFLTTQPSEFRAIEFKSTLEIDLSAFTCTSCTTTADIYYSED